MWGGIACVCSGLWVCHVARWKGPWEMNRSHQWVFNWLGGGFLGIWWRSRTLLQGNAPTFKWRVRRHPKGSRGLGAGSEQLTWGTFILGSEAQRGIGWTQINLTRPETLSLLNNSSPSSPPPSNLGRWFILLLALMLPNNGKTWGQWSPLSFPRIGMTESVPSRGLWLQDLRCAPTSWSWHPAGVFRTDHCLLLFLALFSHSALTPGNTSAHYVTETGPNSSAAWFRTQRVTQAITAHEAVELVVRAGHQAWSDPSCCQPGWTLSPVGPCFTLGLLCCRVSGGRAVRFLRSRVM